MKLFSQLRHLALLRRIARALEGANQLERERLALEFPKASTRKDFVRSPKLTEISVPEVSDWNDKWLKKHRPE